MSAIESSWKEEGASERNQKLTFERREFKDLLNGNKAFVIGRKGSGKTVALTYVERAVLACKAGQRLHPSFLEVETHKPIYIKLDASEISLKPLTGVAMEAAQVNGYWRNMIYGAVLKHLVNFSADLDAGLVGATYYLGELFESFVSAGFHAKAFGVEIRLGSQAENWSTRAHRTLEALKRLAAHVAGPRKVFIAIDKLDGTLSDAMSPELHATYNEVLAGVMDAVAYIAGSGASLLGPKLRLLPIVSMRSDLMRRISRADSHKWFGDDLSVNLNWSEGEIKEMLAHRLAIATGLRREAYRNPAGSVDIGKWFSANWDAVFDKGVIDDDYEPNGSRQRTKFDFVVSRTMDSPRDYTVQIATYAQYSNRHGGGLITKDIMQDCLAPYAHSTLSRVASEAVGSVPDIRERFKQIGGLLSEVRGNRRHFRQGEVTKALRVPTGDKLLNELFLLNVLGNFVQREEGHRYRFAYKEIGAYAPGLNLSSDIVFHPTVYRGLRTA